jgi:hypothetical protein
MEEIAWGQQLFKFETPDTFKQINAQQELTLHNINSLQGKSEIFRLIFGIGGLIGLSLNRSQSFKYLALPKILLPLLLIITLVTLFDFYADFYAINPNLNKLLYKLSELIEFLIGVSGFLYIFLLYRANQLKYTK